MTSEELEKLVNELNRIDEDIFQAEKKAWDLKKVKKIVEEKIIDFHERGIKESKSWKVNYKTVRRSMGQMDNELLQTLSGYNPDLVRRIPGQVVVSYDEGFSRLAEDLEKELSMMGHWDKIKNSKPEIKPQTITGFEKALKEIDDEGVKEKIISLVPISEKKEIQYEKL